jgi:hypothetical protein
MDFQGLIMVICLASFGVFQASGIEGTVYRLSGNQMPSPRRHRPLPDTLAAHHPSPDSPSANSPLPKPKGTGVAGTVCVFELTNDSQVVRQGTSPYCQAVHTRLIRQTNTDDKGNFSILLPPGTYSVFTKKGDLFYATRRDEKNNIAPVEVLPGQMTRVDCRVESDHKVIY